MSGGGKTTTNVVDPHYKAAALGFLKKAGSQYDDYLAKGDLSLGDTAQRAVDESGGVYDRAGADASTIRDLANQDFGSSAAYSEAMQGLGLSNFGGNAGGGRNRLSQAGIGQDALLKHQARQAQLLGQAGQIESGALNQLGQVGSAEQQFKQYNDNRGLTALQAYGNAFGGAGKGFGSTQTTTGK